MESDFYPAVVIETLGLFHEHQLWHQVSRNPPVRSCADAARRRMRLGHVGIPLCDELKSNFGRYRRESSEHLVVAHCRGHQSLDFEKVERHLGSHFQRLDISDIEKMGLTYGSVTPFVAPAGLSLTHLVDPTVIAPVVPPHTMMTNLGHLEYAVEFYPGEVFAAVPGVEIVDITLGGKPLPSLVQNVGILTGNSPESGMLLWQIINRYIRSSAHLSFRGDISFPRVTIESVPEMGLSMELAERADQVRPVVLGAVARLCAHGADVVAVACNTTQYYSSEIAEVCNRAGTAFISLVDETASFLKSEGISRFDLFAIGDVADLSNWSDFRRVSDSFDIVVPSAASLTVITELAFSVKKEVVSGTTINKLRDLVNHTSTTDTIVIALTELSILFHSQRTRQRSTKRYVDTLDVLGKAVAGRFIDARVAAGLT